MKAMSAEPTPEIKAEFKSKMTEFGCCVVDTSYFFRNLKVRTFERGIDADLYSKARGKFVDPRITEHHLKDGVKVTPAEFEVFNTYLHYLDKLVGRLSQFQLRAEENGFFFPPFTLWNEPVAQITSRDWHLDGGGIRSLCPFIGLGTEYKIGEECFLTPDKHTLFLSGKESSLPTTCHRRSPDRSGLANLLVVDYAIYEL